MNTKHRKGYFVLAHALYGPGEAHLCAPCIKRHPDQEEICSVEGLSQDDVTEKYCDFCECKLLASK